MEWFLIELMKRQQQLSRTKRHTGPILGPLTVLAIICLALAALLSWVETQDEIVGYSHHGLPIYRSDLEEENE